MLAAIYGHSAYGYTWCAIQAVIVPVKKYDASCDVSPLMDKVIMTCAC